MAGTLRHNYTAVALCWRSCFRCPPPGVRYRARLGSQLSPGQLGGVACLSTLVSSLSSFDIFCAWRARLRPFVPPVCVCVCVCVSAGVFFGFVLLLLQMWWPRGHRTRRRFCKVDKPQLEDERGDPCHV